MADKWAMLEILRTELRLHPRCGAADIEKLVYQAVFGADHMLPGDASVAAALRDEWVALAPGRPGDAPAIQVIDPDGITARLHLRPCRTMGIDVEDVEHVLNAQPRKNGHARRWSELWWLASELAEQGWLPFTGAELAPRRVPPAPPRHSATYGPTSYRLLNDLSHPGTVSWLRRHGLHTST